MNFKKFAQAAWFGPLNVEGLNFVDDDLDLGNRPIHSISEQDFAVQLRLTEERRRAVEWLVGNDEVYSNVDLST